MILSYVEEEFKRAGEQNRVITEGKISRRNFEGLRLITQILANWRKGQEDRMEEKEKKMRQNRKTIDPIHSLVS